MGSPRIAQVANFYGPQSGGLRTTVDRLGRGYREAGFDRVLVVPGERDCDQETESGRRITLRAPAVPGGGGYRWFPDWRLVARVLCEIGVSRLEVSDKMTLARLGPWATRRGVPAVLLSHERIDAILSPRLPAIWACGRGLTRLADRWNGRLARAFPTVVATSAFSCEEWHRIGAGSVVRVPLGVDLATFRPSASARRAPGPARVVCVGRLSPEKRPDLALGVLKALVEAGIPARLTMVGAGPQTDRLTRWARDRALPVDFTGHVGDRDELARLLAAADVALAPCPVEAFGLSVLESLACGTPVVSCNTGAAAELWAAGCGATAPPTPSALAAAIADVLALDRRSAQVAARRRAQQYPWSRTVAGMLEAHGLESRRATEAAVSRCG